MDGRAGSSTREGCWLAVVNYAMAAWQCRPTTLFGRGAVGRQCFADDDIEADQPPTIPGYRESASTDGQIDDAHSLVVHADNWVTLRAAERYPIIRVDH